MGWPFSEVGLEFKSGMTTASNATIVHGDTLAFNLRPTWDGGLGGGFMGSTLSATGWKASLTRDGLSVLLRNAQVTDNLGAVHTLPFDVRLTPGPGNLELRQPYRLPPGSAVEFYEFDLFEGDLAGSTTVTAEAVDWDGRVLAQSTLTVTVQRFPLRVDPPPPQSVRVSDEIAPPLRVALPGGAFFATDQAFETTILVPPDRRSLSLGGLRAAGRTMPFSLAVQVEPAAGEINGIYFRYPEPSDGLALDAAHVFSSLPPYMVGRKAGAVTVAVHVGVHDPSRFEAPESPYRFAVDVIEQPIEFELTPATGTPPLLLEDDWRPAEPPDGALRGSIRVVARRNGTPIYDSMASAYIVVMQPDAGTLDVQQVRREFGGVTERATDRLLTSIAFALKSADPDMLAIDLTHVGSPGVPSGFGDVFTLRDCLRALSFGDSLLTLTARHPLPEEPTAVFFTLPQPVQLAVKIPHPLRAHLDTWSDAHFNGSTALDLGAGDPAAELIYAHGTLVGRIDEHNPASTAERIEAVIEPPGATNVVVLLQNGVEVADDGAVQAELAGLGYDVVQPSGRNAVKISAWKPINEVVDGGPHVAAVGLTAVTPRNASILEPASGITVRQRMLPRVRYRGERAAKFLIIDQSTLLREDPQEAYTMQERQAANINLSGDAGDHVLRVRAQNDFGTSDASIVIHAPAPTLDVVIRWPSAAIPEDRHVGHSVQRVDADVTVTNGLRLIIIGGSGSQSIDLDPNAAADTRSVRLPPHRDLEVGDNTITIRAENDFGFSERSLTIRRRAHVFETIGDAFLAVEASQEGIPAGDSVFVEATFVFESSVSTHDETWVITQTLPAQADDAFLDFESYDFQFYQMVNGDRQNVSLNAIERAGAIITGPDFQRLTLLFKPDPAWVIDEFPTRELLPGLFDRVLTDHAARGSHRMTVVVVDIETQQEVGADGV